MEGKKKRSCNYTAAEKEFLLRVIINEYLHIFENKDTSAASIAKKRNAWEQITQQYNAIATSGPRTWHQLRHLYENLKQKSKKNGGIENTLQFYEQDEVNTTIKKASEDKGGINKIASGSHKSILSNSDNQLLAMVAPQVKNEPDPYDDAAIYFGDVKTSPSQDVQMEDVHVDESSVDPISTSPTWPQHTDGNKRSINNSSTKEKYFKMKLANARLERKFMINKYKMEQQKLKLEIAILRLRLQNQTKAKLS